MPPADVASTPSNSFSFSRIALCLAPYPPLSGPERPAERLSPSLRLAIPTSPPHALYRAAVPSHALSLSLCPSWELADSPLAGLSPLLELQPYLVAFIIRFVGIHKLTDPALRSALGPCQSLGIASPGRQLHRLPPNADQCSTLNRIDDRLHDG